MILQLIEMTVIIAATLFGVIQLITTFFSIYWYKPLFEWKEHLKASTSIRAKLALTIFF